MLCRYLELLRISVVVKAAAFYALLSRLLSFDVFLHAKAKMPGVATWVHYPIHGMVGGL